MPTEYRSRNFNHCVIYADTFDEIEAIAQDILSGNEKILGFDTEMADSRTHKAYTRVHPITQKQYMPTLMIQLATSTKAYLFHLYDIYKQAVMGKSNEENYNLQEILPPSLKKIIASEVIVKVGFSTHNDNLGLMNTFQLNVSKLLDIDALVACMYLPFNSLKDLVSLSGLSYELKGKDEAHDWTTSLVGKTNNNPGCTDLPRMRTADLEYAALDAIVCLELYKKYMPSPKIVEPGTNESDLSISTWLVNKNGAHKKGEELARYICGAYPPWQRVYNTEDRAKYAKDYVAKIENTSNTQDTVSG